VIKDNRMNEIMKMNIKCRIAIQALLCISLIGFQFFVNKEQRPDIPTKQRAIQLGQSSTGTEHK